MKKLTKVQLELDVQRLRLEVERLREALCGKAQRGWIKVYWPSRPATTAKR